MLIIVVHFVYCNKPGLSRFWLAVRVICTDIPVDTGRKLNVHKTSHEHLIYVLVLRGYIVTSASYDYENPNCNCFYRQKIKLSYHIISVFWIS